MDRGIFRDHDLARLRLRPQKPETRNQRPDRKLDLTSANSRVQESGILETANMLLLGQVFCQGSGAWVSGAWGLGSGFWGLVSGVWGLGSGADPRGGWEVAGFNSLASHGPRRIGVPLLEASSGGAAVGKSAGPPTSCRRPHLIRRKPNNSGNLPMPTAIPHVAGAAAIQRHDTRVQYGRLHEIIHHIAIR